MTDQLDALLDTLSNAITEAIADLPHTWLGDKEQADHVMAVEAGDAAFAAVERVLTATPQSEGLGALLLGVEVAHERHRQGLLGLDSVSELLTDIEHGLRGYLAAADSRPSEGLDVRAIREWAKDVVRGVAAVHIRNTDAVPTFKRRTNACIDRAAVLLALEHEPMAASSDDPS